ncbi:MAG: hypothetical protein ACYC7E_21045 [Armatimonadota bacterium]
MDTSVQQRSVPPVAALIGALLALEGIREVIQLLLGALGERLVQSQGYGNVFGMLQVIHHDNQWWLKFLVGVLSVAVGFGLLRGMRWARLGAMAVLALNIAYILVKLIWQRALMLSGGSFPLWALGNTLISILNLATPLVMLLFLTLPILRKTWLDERNTSLDLLDRWGQAIEKRLPAGLPIVAAFIAIYLIIVGLPSLISVIVTLPGMRDLPNSPMAREFTYALTAGSLIISIGFIAAGVAMLRRARWAKQVTLGAMGLAATELLSLKIIGSVVLLTDEKHAETFGSWVLATFAASNAVNFLLGIATYIILALFLLRALPGRAAEEKVATA